jgi:hypothetical protein
MHLDNDRDLKEERQIPGKLVSDEPLCWASQQKDATRSFKQKDADYSVVSQWPCKSCVSICTFVPVKVFLYQYSTSLKSIVRTGGSRALLPWLVVVAFTVEEKERARGEEVRCRWLVVTTKSAIACHRTGGAGKGRDIKGAWSIPWPRQRARAQERARTLAETRNLWLLSPMCYVFRVVSEEILGEGLGFRV